MAYKHKALKQTATKHKSNNIEGKTDISAALKGLSPFYF